MSKKVFIWMVLLSFSFALENLSIKKGWELYGISSGIEDVNFTFSDFNDSVGIIWGYNYNDSKWGAYSPNFDIEQKIKNDTTISNLTKIEAQRGFWIYGLKEDNITINYKINTENRVIYDITQFPVNNYSGISSPFGPRLKASDNYRYDYHRGIDIAGNLNEPIYSIADGEVYKIYNEGSSSYPDGGNVVVIRHTMDTPINFHGQNYSEYYSLYMHLNTIDTTETKTITKGELIGTMGESGTTTFNHLHFEIRIATTCSREYQIANPSSICANTFNTPTDPHVNPYLFLDYNNSNSLTLEVTQVNPLTILVTSNRDELDFNEIKVTKDSIEKIVNFNLRDGIDPNNIDNSNYNDINITPLKFNTSSDKYQINFEFNTLNSYDYIEVSDIWGGTIKLKGHL